MPITYFIDHDRHLVLAEGHGTVTAEEIFDYQHEVWSMASVAGYDELVDMSGVQEVADPSSARIRGLAQLSAAMDPPRGAGKFAIVAPQEVFFGLGRMYQTLRELNEQGTKRVAVFRDRDTALRWLGGTQSGPPGPVVPSPEPSP